MEKVVGELKGDSQWSESFSGTEGIISKFGGALTFPMSPIPPGSIREGEKPVEISN